MNVVCLPYESQSLGSWQRQMNTGSRGVLSQQPKFINNKGQHEVRERLNVHSSLGGNVLQEAGHAFNISASGQSVKIRIRQTEGLLQTVVVVSLGKLYLMFAAVAIFAALITLTLEKGVDVT